MNYWRLTNNVVGDRVVSLILNRLRPIIEPKDFPMLSIVFSLVMMFFSLHASLASSAPTPLFLYDAEVSVQKDAEHRFVVSPELEEMAKRAYFWMDSSIYFDTKIIWDAAATRKIHTKKKPKTSEIGRLFSVETIDHVKIDCTYFDRGSDTLIVVAEGFTNSREHMSPFITMYPDKDIVLFDFRGHGANGAGLLNFAKTVAGIDTSKVRLGLEEDKDVRAVVNGFKKYKTQCTGTPYKQVIGLGLCYGAFVTAKAQAMHKVFDKIILDGCWLSLPLFVEKIRADLQTINNPQTGGWANHWFWSNTFVRGAAEAFVRYILGLKYTHNISFLEFADKLADTPILFIQGKDDYMIRREEFAQVWNAVPGDNKMVLLTSREHVRNHLKQKELYKLSTDLFIEYGIDKAYDVMSDRDAVKNYFISSLSDSLSFGHKGLI